MYSFFVGEETFILRLLLKPLTVPTSFQSITVSLSSRYYGAKIMASELCSTRSVGGGTPTRSANPSSNRHKCFNLPLRLKSSSILFTR